MSSMLLNIILKTILRKEVKAMAVIYATVDTLVKLNGIKNKNLINIGQVIKLP